jgi:photosystem II stability/assembly factor-like uncharacterized protein
MSLKTKPIKRVIGYAALMLSIWGCEAPLNLDGIARETALNTHRFDQLQASASNDQAIVVVGSSGVVLQSSDNGQNWQRQILSGLPTLIDITACNNGQLAALAAERQLWLSNNNGGDWQAFAIDTQESLTALACAPDNTLWIGGSFSTLLSSKDPTKGWSTFSLGEDAMITEIQFIDDNNAVVLGEFGLVLTSSDQGTTWQQAPALPNEFYPQAGLFLTPQEGYVVGLNGKILATTDGGKSWQFEISDTEKPLYGLSLHNGELYAVGENSVMLQRQGNRWSTLSHQHRSGSYLRAILPLQGSNLLVAGGSGALFSIAPNLLNISTVKE